MRIIRRIVFILVLLGLIFVVYRFFNPQGADNFISKFKGNLDISQTTSQQEDEEDAEVISGDVLSLEEDIITQTGADLTQTGENLIQSGEDTNEILSLTSNMSGYKEVITSSKEVVDSLGPGYQDPYYNFSLSFPRSREAYGMGNLTGKDIKSILTFGHGSTSYFKIYIIDLKYYIPRQNTEFSGLQYLDQDKQYAFLYKIFDYSKSKDPEIINKSKAVKYIIQTFRLVSDNTTTTTTITTPKPTTSAPTTSAPKPTTTTQATTTPKPTTNQQDVNDAKSLFDNFIE